MKRFNGKFILQKNMLKINGSRKVVKAFLKSKMNPLTLAPGASAGVLANARELLFIRAD
jgi:hypothetical protein